MIPKKFLDEMPPKDRHDYLSKICADPRCHHVRSAHGIYGGSARACNVRIQIRPIDHIDCKTSEGLPAPSFRDSLVSACGCESFKEEN